MRRKIYDNNKMMKRDANERELFEKLIRENYKTMEARALSVANNNQALAEDILALAVEKAWKEFDSFQRDKRFTHWVYRIILNCGIDSIRNVNLVSKDLSFENISDKIDDDFSQNIVDSRVDIYAEYERKEKLEEVMAMVASLPSSYQEVLLLSAEGHSYEEISELTELTLGTVRARIHRAKKMLQTKYSHLM